VKWVAASYTRVEEHTRRDVNDRIREQTAADIAYYARHPDEIDGRLAELDREWDTERWLQLNSAILSLIGLGLAASRGPRWLALPVAVQLFFLQHGVQGWCPPLPAFRRVGVRTVREIEIERTALRALRGDYSAVAARRAGPEHGTDGQNGDGAGRPGPASTAGRVRATSPSTANRAIDRAVERRLRYFADHPEQARHRLAELDREWDIERLVEVEGPATTLSGIAAGLLSDRKGWLAVPIFAQSMMVLHALAGAYPLLPLLRMLGFRTLGEIAAERYAIKALLGDFEPVHAESAGRENSADAALRAATPGDGY